MTCVQSRLQTENIISQFSLSRVNNKQVKMSAIQANRAAISPSRIPKLYVYVFTILKSEKQSGEIRLATWYHDIPGQCKISSTYYLYWMRLSNAAFPWLILSIYIIVSSFRTYEKQGVNVSTLIKQLFHSIVEITCQTNSLHWAILALGVAMELRPTLASSSDTTSFELYLQSNLRFQLWILFFNTPFFNFRHNELITSDTTSGSLVEENSLKKKQYKWHLN